jgi:hypothetical protein
MVERGLFLERDINLLNYFYFFNEIDFLDDRIFKYYYSNDSTSFYDFYNIFIINNLY